MHDIFLSNCNAPGGGIQVVFLFGIESMIQESEEKTVVMSHVLDDTGVLAKHFAEIDRILEKHERRPAALIPILQEVQALHRYLSREDLAYIASGIGVAASQVYGVATFFAHFSLNPKGKHIIKLCDGTACHVKKSTSILDALSARLKLTDDKRTSEDLMFTLETVSCLGACGLAPAMVIDEEVYGQLTPQEAVAIIDRMYAAEKEA